MKKHFKKALKHEVEVLGRNISTLAIAVVLLIGAGSAAVIQNYGVINGTGDANQAITVQGESDNTVKFGFDGDSFAAPETFNEPVTLVNQNPNDSVSYTWRSTESYNGNPGNQRNLKTGVFKISHYDDVEVEKSGADTSEPESDVNMTIEPSVETVTYTFELSEKFEESGHENFALYIGEESSNNPEYQVVYQPGNTDSSFTAEKEDFAIKKYSSGWTGFKSFSEVESAKDAFVSSDGKTVTVEVARNSGQTFKAFGSITGADTDNVDSDGDGETGDDNHERFNIGDDLGQVDGSLEMVSSNSANLENQEVEIQGGNSENYNVVAHFGPATAAGQYSATLAASTP